ncbi:MAG: lipoyl synthase [Desulfobacterales bacterium]
MPLTDAKKQTMPGRKPRWLMRSLPSKPEYETVRSLIAKGGLHTVCQEARCPNQFECFSRSTATFLILGSRCTRNCGFCAIEHGPDSHPDPEEARKVAQTAAKMGLRYVVVTSVTRDDLADGGAGMFAETIREIRSKIPHALIEVLIPDFQGDECALRTVLDAHPHVLNHNVETVPRLYSTVRPQAAYERSLELITRAKKYAPDIPAKSGIMLGLGEREEEIEQTLKDLHRAGCSFLTMGQYLRPCEKQLAVKRYITPEEFGQWRKRALRMGFAAVAAGPFVRSSYHAGEMYQAGAQSG